MQSSTDIDECAAQSPCHTNALCTNTLGSFTCACNAGYTGDGLTCYGRCLHIDCTLFTECNTSWVPVVSSNPSVSELVYH